MVNMAHLSHYKEKCCSYILCSHRTRTFFIYLVAQCVIKKCSLAEQTASAAKYALNSGVSHAKTTI